MKSGFYTIPLIGLKEGSHHYDFKMDGDFFEQFEESEIMKADLNAYVRLIKRSAHMELKVELEGSVEIMCDRCLENFFQAVRTEDDLFIKFGNRFEEVDDKVLIVPSGENELDLEQLIYEFAHLGLPLKRMHPTDKIGESKCNPVMIEKLGKHLYRDMQEEDPRWKELGKLRDNLLN